MTMPKWETNLMDFQDSLKILGLRELPHPQRQSLNLLAVWTANSASSTSDARLHRGVGSNIWAGGEETSSKAT